MSTPETTTVVAAAGELRWLVRETIKHARGQRRSRPTWPAWLEVDPACLAVYCALRVAHDCPELEPAWAGDVAAQLMRGGRPRHRPELEAHALLEHAAAAALAAYERAAGC